MFPVPKTFLPLLSHFAPCFAPQVRKKFSLFVMGSILTPARRTVTHVLETCGLAQSAAFSKFHRIFNRDRWSSLEVGRILLLLLINTFSSVAAADQQQQQQQQQQPAPPLPQTPPAQQQQQQEPQQHFSAPLIPLLFAVDSTLERRRSLKIILKALYRDPVRSSKSMVVKVQAVRWQNFSFLGIIPWAAAAATAGAAPPHRLLQERLWALPFLTVTAPGRRYSTTPWGAHCTTPPF